MMKQVIKLTKLVRKLPWKTILLLVVVSFGFHSISLNEEDPQEPVTSTETSSLSIQKKAVEVEIEEPKGPFVNVTDEKAKELLDEKLDEIDKLRKSFNKLPTFGQEPLRGIIVSTWRGGCEAIGQFLAGHPAVYYHYEPLLWYGVRRMKTDQETQLAAQMTSTLFKCQYQPHIASYKQQYVTKPELMLHNGHLWPHCRKVGWRSWCLRPEFLDNFCSIFPVQIMKTVRIGINVTSQLLNDTSIGNLRVLLLVRDPRATIISRSNYDWCSAFPDCEDPKNVCQDLVKDFHDYNTLKTQYPGQIMALRYEDFLANQKSMGEKVANFFGLTVVDKMSNYLGVKDEVPHYSWPIKTTDIVQNECQQAMQLWGYKVLVEPSRKQNKHPLTALTF